MPVYLIERVLNCWVLKNLDNPIASCTGIELNNLQRLPTEKSSRESPSPVPLPTTALVAPPPP